MRYLSYYREYPIYEPAEGGYYYVADKTIRAMQNDGRMKKD